MLGNWTDERVGLLKQLWTVEGKSAGQISTIMGITRSAVIGKVHRLGLGGGDHQIVQSFKPPKKPPPPPPEPKRRIAIKPLPFLAVPLLKLKPDQCRYPDEAENGPPYSFCGQPTNGTTPYCPHHHRVVYVRVEPMRPPSYYEPRFRK